MFIIRSGLFVLLLVFSTTFILAESATLSTTFSYDDGGDADATLQGVRLYVDGQLFCQADLEDISPVGSNSVFDCTNELAYGTRNYTLTGLRADGGESPHSAAFSYTINAPPPGTPDQPPAPILIEVKIFINGVEYTITN